MFVTLLMMIAFTFGCDGSGPESEKMTKDKEASPNQYADQIMGTLLTGLPDRITTESSLKAVVVGLSDGLFLKYNLSRAN